MRYRAMSRTTRSAAGRTPRTNFSAASVKPERDGADSNGVDPLIRPYAMSVVRGGRSIAARLSAPRLATLRLDVLADCVQHVSDARAGQGQSCDRNDRDQRDDQGVLDQCLPFLRPHLGQLDSSRERMNHVGSPFSPRGGLPVLSTLFTPFELTADTRERLVLPIRSAQTSSRKEAWRGRGAPGATRRTSDRWRRGGSRAAARTAATRVP